MRKSTTHVALDKQPNRFTIHERTHVLAIHDNVRKLEYRLYSYGTQRHNDDWSGLDAHALVDWLNERALGYPRNDRIAHACKVKGATAAEAINEPPFEFS
jgi:hypothetical protein